MSLPQLTAKTPEVVPAKPEEEIVEIIPASPEEVYDKLWMTQFSIVAPSTTEDARLVATFKYARDVGEYKELKDDEEQLVITISDLFARMAVSPSLASAMSAVLEEVIVIGKEKGIMA